MQEKDTGTLYIIATPIGNLEDITLRALRVLDEVDTVFCEDTRVTGRLLHHHGIKVQMQSMNARTEEKKIHLVLQLLSEGKDVAYVSDAGTPGISDPGVRLVSAVRANNKNLGVELLSGNNLVAGVPSIEIVSIPGASALTAALSIAGVPTNKFTFLGFLPQKKGRQTQLRYIATLEHTVVLYESTHRIIKLLKELQEYLPMDQESLGSQAKKITIAREITKMHEEVLQGSAKEILEILETNPQKQRGEFVVIISK